MDCVPSKTCFADLADVEDLAAVWRWKDLAAGVPIPVLVRLRAVLFGKTNCALCPEAMQSSSLKVLEEGRVELSLLPSPPWHGLLLVPVVSFKIRLRKKKSFLNPVDLVPVDR